MLEAIYILYGLRVHFEGKTERSIRFSTYENPSIDDSKNVTVPKPITEQINSTYV